MTEWTLHATPRARDVVLEQIRVTALALRGAAIVLTALIGVATLFGIIDTISAGGSIDFDPAQQMLPAIAGLLLPIFVWRWEERFGAGFLWTLPVDRRQHALARVFAGWVWLMAAIALFVLWQLGITLISGGNIMGEETVRLLPSSSPAMGSVPLEPVRTLRWTPQPWLWLVSFTAATGMYLLSSALLLGVRRPLRWIVGIVLGFFLIGLALVEANSEALRLAPSRLVRWIFESPYGLDQLMTARTESLQTTATLSNQETVIVWRGLPHVGEWAVATLLWTSAGLLALWAAATRHRERRRT